MSKIMSSDKVKKIISDTEKKSMRKHKDTKIGGLLQEVGRTGGESVSWSPTQVGRATGVFKKGNDTISLTFEKCSVGIRSPVGVTQPRNEICKFKIFDELIYRKVKQFVSIPNLLRLTSPECWDGLTNAMALSLPCPSQGLTNTECPVFQALIIRKKAS